MSFKTAHFFAVIIFCTVIPHSLANCELENGEWNCNKRRVVYVNWPLIYSLGIGLPVFIIIVCVASCVFCVGCPLYAVAHRRSIPIVPIHNPMIVVDQAPPVPQPTTSYGVSVTYNVPSPHHQLQAPSFPQPFFPNTKLGFNQPPPYSSFPPGQRF